MTTFHSILSKKNPCKKILRCSAVCNSLISATVTNQQQPGLLNVLLASQTEHETDEYTKNILMVILSPP